MNIKILKDVPSHDTRNRDRIKLYKKDSIVEVDVITQDMFDLSKRHLFDKVGFVLVLDTVDYEVV